MDIHNKCNILIVRFSFILFSFFFVLMGGCSSIASKYNYIKKDKVETQISELKKEYNIKLNDNQSKIEKTYNDIIDKQNKNSQEANVNVYGIINLSGIKDNKGRIDNLIEFKSRAAFKLLPPPTPEQLIAENDNIKKELDETRVSLSDLTEKYSKIEIENSKRASEVAMANKDLEKLKEDKIKIDKEFAAKEHDLQEVRNKLNKEELSNSAKREADLKSDKEMRAKIAYGAAAFGAILILLGLMILKSPLMAMLGGGSIAFSLFVATAPQWVLWGVPLILFVGGGVILFLKYRKEKMIGDGNIRAIQRFKEVAKDKYDEILKPILTNEHGKYDKNGVVIPDESKAKEIDKRLMELNIK